MPGCLIITGIYGNVFYLSRFENNLKLSTLNNYDYKPSIDCFISYSKLALGIFDYVYNNCDNSEGVEWVTRYFMECSHIEISNIDDLHIGMVVTTNTAGTYFICRMDLIMSITDVGNFEYISEYPICYENSKVNKTREIVHTSFMKIATELIK